MKGDMGCKGQGRGRQMVGGIGCQGQGREDRWADIEVKRGSLLEGVQLNLVACWRRGQKCNHTMSEIQS